MSALRMAGMLVELAWAAPCGVAITVGWIVRLRWQKWRAERRAKHAMQAWRSAPAPPGWEGIFRADVYVERRGNLLIVTKRRS